jgi:phosphomannomutase
LEVRRIDLFSFLCMNLLVLTQTLLLIATRAGSDLPKQEEQLGAGIAKEFPWNFSQNGLVAYKNGELQEIQTVSKHLGEDNVKRISNWVLAYLAKVDIPIKVCNTLSL